MKRCKCVTGDKRRSELQGDKNSSRLDDSKLCQLVKLQMAESFPGADDCNIYKREKEKGLNTTYIQMDKLFLISKALDAETDNGLYLLFAFSWKSILICQRVHKNAHKEPLSVISLNFRIR